MTMKTTLAALALLSAVSAGASAAELITAPANNLTPAGTISVSGVNGSPADIRQALSDKADSKGAKAYRVIEAYQNGNYHATAEIYQ
ncbi:MAG: peroxide/acid stress response protein YhcN [Yersiniaceae bacterium]|uniref:YdgH/BhsA/McbA-like domain-containing protein n=1 Tax=Chimaeribacter coloradensis TaxID=2060068 RepID=A0A2N5DZZ1_9GAMM|nr:peroxide/acid stress response protein YhcN [Chimaeribacter coloradensis]MDU6411364.1 peroxide/acid stress response protein YhcN [Yersiniaceae bacterium]PLR33414.1 hypothetical protein CYR32_13895 [Chimaeribacter coloradensis]